MRGKKKYKRECVFNSKVWLNGSNCLATNEAAEREPPKRNHLIHPNYLSGSIKSFEFSNMMVSRTPA